MISVVEKSGAAKKIMKKIFRVCYRKTFVVHNITIRPHGHILNILA
jgi:hypothetical protein